ncbi:MAG: hypothetical protein ABI583_02575 [Betaproteobacteria bacterium]
MTFDAAAQQKRVFKMPSLAKVLGEKKPPDVIRRFFCSNARNVLNLFDGFEHLECGLARADKQAFEVFTQTLALQRVAACALFFSSHGDLLNVNAIAESIEL